MAKNIKLIFKDIFSISLFFYLLFLLINGLTHNFFQYFINLNIFLWIIVISGILYGGLQLADKKL